MAKYKGERNLTSIQKLINKSKSWKDIIQSVAEKKAEINSESYENRIFKMPHNIFKSKINNE